MIPVHNRVDLTRACLDALAKHSAGLDYEVVVVDNASTDGTAAALAAYGAAGRVRGLRNEENLGFGRACNRGAALAGGEYVLLLNNDVLALPGWWQPLLAAAGEDGVGAVGSRLLYPNGAIQHAGVAFGDEGTTYHLFRGAPADYPPALAARDLPAVTGACLLLPRALWRELGGLDEGYRMYVEDIDLCQRVWASGHRVRYCPESVLVHLENASAASVADRDEQVLAGWARFRESWPEGIPAAAAAANPTPFALGSDLRRLVVAAAADELVAAPELLAGYCDRVTAADDATLVVFSPSETSEDVGARVAAALAGAGFDLAALPDLLAVGGFGDDRAQLALAARAGAVLSGGRTLPALSRLPRFDRAPLETVGR